jgi:hypothetical protein
MKIIILLVWKYSYRVDCTLVLRPCRYFVHHLNACKCDHSSSIPVLDNAWNSQYDNIWQFCSPFHEYIGCFTCSFSKIGFVHLARVDCYTEHPFFFGAHFYLHFSSKLSFFVVLIRSHANYLNIKQSLQRAWIQRFLNFQKMTTLYDWKYNKYKYIYVYIYIPENNKLRFEVEI